MWLLSCLPAQKARLWGAGLGGGRAAAFLKQPPGMPVGLWWQGLARRAGAGWSTGNAGAPGTRNHLETSRAGQKCHSRGFPGTGARSHPDGGICFQGEAGVLLTSNTSRPYTFHFKINKPGRMEALQACSPSWFAFRGSVPGTGVSSPPKKTHPIRITEISLQSCSCGVPCKPQGCRGRCPAAG